MFRWDLNCGLKVKWGLDFERVGSFIDRELSCGSESVYGYVIKGL